MYYNNKFSESNMKLKILSQSQQRLTFKVRYNFAKKVFFTEVLEYHSTILCYTMVLSKIRANLTTYPYFILEW